MSNLPTNFSPTTQSGANLVVKLKSKEGLIQCKSMLLSSETMANTELCYYLGISILI